MMCHKPSKKGLFYLSTNNILVILGFERQLIRRGSGMVHPIQIDIIFLDSPDSSLRSRRRMTLRVKDDRREVILSVCFLLPLTQHMRVTLSHRGRGFNMDFLTLLNILVLPMLCKKNDRFFYTLKKLKRRKKKNGKKCCKIIKLLHFLQIRDIIQKVLKKCVKKTVVFFTHFFIA